MGVDPPAADAGPGLTRAQRLKPVVGIVAVATIGLHCKQGAGGQGNLRPHRRDQLADHDVAARARHVSPADVVAAELAQSRRAERKPRHGDECGCS
jgi:hypothetical protein